MQQPSRAARRCEMDKNIVTLPVVRIERHEPFHDLGKLELCLAQRDQLHDALQQLVDYVIDGCPEGSYIAVIEAKAALANIRVVSAA
jgi:hypothetical protein